MRINNLINFPTGEGYSTSIRNGNEKQKDKHPIITSELTIDQLYKYFDSIKNKRTKPLNLFNG